MQINRLKKKHAKHSRKDSHSVLYWCAIGLLLFVVVAAGAYFASSSLFGKKRPSLLTQLRPNQTETLLVATDKATIMVMGVDERTDDIGRSDTLMLATVDPKLNRVSLFSIPRDTRVDVPGYGFDKINVAYSLGGHKLTKETVEEFLDTPVDHYVIIKIPAFKRIIDAIGGVDIDVEKRMYYVDEWDDDGGLYIDLYPGVQHMNGATAITYVRYRDEEGDIGRVERQQKFMRAVLEKVTSPAILPRLPDIIREIMGAMETDMSFREMLELTGALKEARESGLKMAAVAGRPAYIDEIFYWIPDIYQARESIASTLGISMTQRAKDEMEREASVYESSLPPGALDTPADEDIIIRRGGRYDEVRPSVGDEDTDRRDTQLTRPPRPTRPGQRTDSEDDETETTTRPGIRPSTRVPQRDTGEGRDTTGRPPVGPNAAESESDGTTVNPPTEPAEKETEPETPAAPVESPAVPQREAAPAPAPAPAGSPGRGAGDMVKR